MLAMLGKIKQVKVAGQDDRSKIGSVQRINNKLKQKTSQTGPALRTSDSCSHTWPSAQKVPALGLINTLRHHLQNLNLF